MTCNDRFDDLWNSKALLFGIAILPDGRFVRSDRAHYCRLDEDHKGLHICSCGVMWPTYFKKVMG